MLSLSPFGTLRFETPRIETGDARYRHLNPLQLVAGGFVKSGVTTLEVASLDFRRSTSGAP